jgi:hypothetical protein
MYSAIVLDKKSASKLADWFNTHLKNKPDGWRYVGHHSTIKMGELPTKLKPLIGESITLTVTHLGWSDKAIAVKVDGNIYSTNEIPHITLMVNYGMGGKPVDSNHITRWERVNPFRLNGIIMEVK